jgi:putative membrane protein
MGATMDVSGFTDGQIAAVMQAINQGEIQAAQLAQSKATSSDVKRFAQHMVTDHRDMQNKANTLLSRMQVTVTENPVSTQLRSDAQNELTMLQSETGRDFDRTYIDAQVRNHNQALELIDRITPNVKSTDFRSQLQSARPKIEQHLREAERLQQMSQGTTNKQHTSGSEDR